MIKLNHLEKSVKTKAGFLYLLRQINLDIEEGEFLTIMGPSGAGKSTLLGILGFYDHAWEGEFLFNDQAVHTLDARARATLNKRLVGFVFQQFHLLDDLTVAENLDELLLADEPTGNLHSDQGREIMELFKKLNREGTTIVQVTHSEANAACGNRIVRMRDGWLEK